MNRLTKPLALALAMIFIALASVSYVAAIGAPSGNEYMQVELKTDTATTYPGAYVTVTLNISNNYYATAMRFPILFSKDVFEIEGPTLSLQKHGQLSVVTGNLSANTSGNPNFIPNGYSSDDYGVLLVQWLGTANAGLFGCFNRPEGDNCISFRLKVKQTAQGTGELLIPGNSNLFYYQAMNDPADGTTVYNMSATTCSMSFVPTSVEVGDASPDIDIFPGASTVIDRENFLVYGLAVSLDSLEDFVIPVGEAELDYTPYDGFSFGTGSKVNVTKDGVLVCSYTVVIFGDVNGDSFVDSTDAIMINDYENFVIDWQTGEDDAFLLAADISKDFILDSSDAGSMVDYENFLLDIDQIAGTVIVL